MPHQGIVSLAGLFLMLCCLDVRAKEWRGIVPLKSTRADVKRLFGKPNQLMTTGWRGLSPLKSTRADVERLLGKPDVHNHPESMTYYLSDVVVFINLSANPKCTQALPYPSWDVSPETVTVIRVTLREPVPVSNAGIDLTKLKKVHGDYDVADHFYYSKTEDGFSVEVGQNYVRGYIYEPGPKHKDLLCPTKQ